jgi:hypothetical protein
MKILSAILVIIVFAGCSSNPEHKLSRPQKDDRTLKDVSPFFAAVSLAGSVVVYEGLPHQMWEETAYATEVKRRDLVWFEGYPFYATPLSVPQKELKRLTAIALRKEAHVRYSGFKMCGGYHPDYAVVWEKEGKQSGSLICLGCHEWKNFTSQGWIYEDLEPAAYAELREILSKYVVHRPTIKKAKQAPEPVPMAASAYLGVASP